ncbi:MAG: glycosyltransferase [Candidatus Omnitrophota bacterium]
MKKIILIYSTAGLGHKKAAMALLKVFQDRVKGAVEVKAIDLLEYASPFYRFLYTTFYIFVVSRARWLWWIIYYIPNYPFMDLFIKPLRDFADSRHLKKLVEELARENPDAIVATHFLLPGITGVLKKAKGFHSKMYAVVTDYGPHSYWLSKNIDGYFVGSEFTSKEMQKRKVPEEKMTVTGIPVGEEFAREFDMEKLREDYGLAKDKKTIFLLSGGFGVGPMKEILLSLNSCKSDIQVITVCGHNKEMYDDIDQLKSRLKYPVVLIGYTDKVAELMSVSDLMITKAGGISTTEAMSARLPMIFFASIPGQETWNEQLLTANNAAEKARRVEEIPALADKVLLSEDVSENLKAGIDKIRRPDAAERIVDIVLDQIGGQNG